MHVGLCSYNFNVPIATSANADKKWTISNDRDDVQGTITNAMKSMSRLMIADHFQYNYKFFGMMQRDLDTSI